MWRPSNRGPEILADALAGFFGGRSERRDCRRRGSLCGLAAAHPRRQWWHRKTPSRPWNNGRDSNALVCMTCHLMSLNAELIFLSKSFQRRQNFSELAIAAVFLVLDLNLIHIFQSKFHWRLIGHCSFHFSASLLFLFRVASWAGWRWFVGSAWMAGGTTLPVALPRLALLRSQTETGGSSVIFANVSLHPHNPWYVQGVF